LYKLLLSLPANLRNSTSSQKNEVKKARYNKVVSASNREIALFGKIANSFYKNGLQDRNANDSNSLGLGF